MLISFPVRICLKALSYQKKKEDWEHVTKIFFDHPKKFKLYNLIAPKKYLLPKLSFLLDYKKDYVKIKKLLSIAHKDNFNEQIGCEDIIKIVKNNPNFF